MITDILNKNVAKILTLFSISPGSKLTRNEIKQKTMLNNTPLDNTLIRLLKNKILQKEKRLISLNLENKNAKTITELAREEHLRFKEIPLKTYYLLIDISAYMSSISKISRTYLFGSYAKLIYAETSDVDIAVILKKEENELTKRITKEITKIEKNYGKTVEPHFFTEKDLKAKDPLIEEIKRNSVIL